MGDLSAASRSRLRSPVPATSTTPRGWIHDGVAGGAVGAVVSGAPSTVHALVVGDDPLEASLAAGSMLLPNEKRPARLLLVAAPVHAALSLGWGVALARFLPDRHTVAFGAMAGMAIAAIDMGVIGRRFARVQALRQIPQIADHVLFGATVAAVVSRRRRSRAAQPSSLGRAAGAAG